MTGTILLVIDYYILCVFYTINPLLGLLKGLYVRQISAQITHYIDKQLKCRSITPVQLKYLRPAV